MRDKAAGRGGRGGQGGQGRGHGGRGNKRNVSSMTQDDSDQQESNKGSQNGSSLYCEWGFSLFYCFTIRFLRLASPTPNRNYTPHP